MSYGLEVLEEFLIDQDVALEMKYRELESGEWSTRDGELIKIENMDIQHIRNCIRMLNRNRANDELAQLWIEKFEAELDRRRNDKW